MNLTPAMFELIRADLVAAILSESRDALTLLSPAQAAGLLDIDPRTLRSTNCPRVVISPKVQKYRLSDLQAYITANLEK